MNTKTQEALHKALKVLNCLNNDRVYETAWVKGAINACEEALASNSEALAQQSQNNLRWANAVIDAHKDGYKACKEALEQPSSKNIRDSFNEMLEDKVAYYKGKQPAQEPDFWMKDMVLYYYKPDDAFKYTPLYTHPAPSWQGLSDDEIFNLSQQCDLNHILGLIDFARAIEQALKEKNT